jgi:hypothetical protein
MNRLLIALVMLPSIIQAQKVLYDKQDPFTKVRTISIGNATITNVLQSGVSAKISDTTKTFFISFLIQTTPGLKLQLKDSIVKECMLKGANDRIFRGQWFGNADMPIGSKFYTSSTYIISEEDFKDISSTEIVAIKVNDILFEPSSKNKSAITNLCKTLLTRL